MENKKEPISTPAEMLQEPAVPYQIAIPDEQLVAALKRTDFEKFQFFMQLVKTQRTMQKFTITHKEI